MKNKCFYLLIIYLIKACFNYSNKEQYFNYTIFEAISLRDINITNWENMQTYDILESINELSNTTKSFCEKANSDIGLINPNQLCPYNYLDYIPKAFIYKIKFFICANTYDIITLEVMNSLDISVIIWNNNIQKRVNKKESKYDNITLIIKKKIIKKSLQLIEIYGVQSNKSKNIQVLIKSDNKRVFESISVKSIKKKCLEYGFGYDNLFKQEIEEDEECYIW